MIYSERELAKTRDVWCMPTAKHCYAISYWWNHFLPEYCNVMQPSVANGMEQWSVLIFTVIEVLLIFFTSVLESCNNYRSDRINCLVFSDRPSNFINFELSQLVRSPSPIWSYQFLRSFRSPILFLRSPASTCATNIFYLVATRYVVAYVVATT